MYVRARQCGTREQPCQTLQHAMRSEYDRPSVTFNVSTDAVQVFSETVSREIRDCVYACVAAVCV